MTRAFSGRPARGIVNRFMTEIERAGAPAAILPFPLQNALTRPLRNAAARQDRIDYLSLWRAREYGWHAANRPPPSLHAWHTRLRQSYVDWPGQINSLVRLS